MTALIPTGDEMHIANSYIQLKNPEGDMDVIRYDMFVKQLFKADTDAMMKLHGALGACGEAGELADAIKNELIYKKGLNLAWIKEELGDLFFYAHSIMNLYGIKEQEVLQLNGYKLEKRYAGLRYSDEAAQNRADKA